MGYMSAVNPPIWQVDGSDLSSQVCDCDQNRERRAKRCRHYPSPTMPNELWCRGRGAGGFLFSSMTLTPIAGQ
jgi:hypothetical protein